MISCKVVLWATSGFLAVTGHTAGAQCVHRSLVRLPEKNGHMIFSLPVRVVACSAPVAIVDLQGRACGILSLLTWDIAVPRRRGFGLALNNNINSRTNRASAGMWHAGSVD